MHHISINIIIKMWSKRITAKDLAITLFAHSVAAILIQGHPYITVPTGTVSTVNLFLPV